MVFPYLQKFIQHKNNTYVAYSTTIRTYHAAMATKNNTPQIFLPTKNMKILPMKFNTCTVTHKICDPACKNQPGERKLHLVMNIFHSEMNMHFL